MSTSDPEIYTGLAVTEDHLGNNGMSVDLFQATVTGNRLIVN